MTIEYEYGKKAYVDGQNFLEHNPYLCTDPKHYEWSKGWFEMLRKDELELRRLYEEEERLAASIQEEAKKRKTKKEKLEDAGQGSLF